MLTEGDHDNMRGFAPEPTERMTDERLAEIEATLYEDTDNVEELLQALKAERAEVVRLCESNAALVRVEISQQKAIEAAEAKLAELMDSLDVIARAKHSTKEQLLDELEALLK